MGIPRIEVDSGPATADQLAYPAIVNYGHFTAMQVRGGAVRGLGVHLSRLDSATREMSGTSLDGDLVRANVRHALGTDIWPDAPALPGVTMQLVTSALAGYGGQVDDLVLPADPGFIRNLAEAYDSVAWDRI